MARRRDSYRDDQWDDQWDDRRDSRRDDRRYTRRDDQWDDRRDSRRNDYRDNRRDYRQNDRWDDEDDLWNEDPRDRRAGAPKKKSAAGTFLLTLLLVVAVGVFVFSGYKLLGFYMDYKAGSDEYSELNKDFASEEKTSEKTPQTDGPSALTDVTQLENPDTLPKLIENAVHETATENQETKSLPTLVNPVDFTQLQAINPDVIGWIRVGAVNVSYPVARAEDNDYYLHRTFRKVDNFAGCIFENCDNSPYFTDQNTIIYGHNMKNGTMFGQLRKFAEQETLDKNPYFWIFTPNFIYQYRIFSSSIVGTTGDPYSIRFTVEDYQKFINDAFARSEVNCGNVSVTPSDRVVTLSTCTGDSSTRRIVQGVLEQIYIAK